MSRFFKIWGSDCVNTFLKASDSGVGLEAMGCDRSSEDYSPNDPSLSLIWTIAFGSKYDAKLTVLLGPSSHFTDVKFILIIIYLYSILL